MKQCMLCGTISTKHWYSKLSQEPEQEGRTYCFSCYKKDWHQKCDTPEKREQARIRSAQYRTSPAFVENKKLWRKGLNQRFSKGKQRARRIDKPWTLTKEEYAALISNPCYYCSNKLGAPVSVGVGLDRLDNTQGYTLQNAVCCCEFCNSLKMDKLIPEEMKLVANTLIRGRGLENYQPPYNTQYQVQQRVRIFGRPMSEDTKKKISEKAKRKSAGEKNPKAKLNNDLAKQIRSQFAEGASIKQLASQYGVSDTTISSIVRNRTWLLLV